MNRKDKMISKFVHDNGVVREKFQTLNVRESYSNALHIYTLT